MKYEVVCPICGNELDQFISFTRTNRCRWCKSQFEADEVDHLKRDRKKKCVSNNDVDNGNEPGAKDK